MLHIIPCFETQILIYDQIRRGNCYFKLEVRFSRIVKLKIRFFFFRDREIKNYLYNNN